MAEGISIGERDNRIAKSEIGNEKR